MLVFMLLYSRFQMRWTTARYERSRWLICLAMVLLSLHYVLQMTHGLRASGDDVGAVVNILFYSPAVMLISLGILNVECGVVVRRPYFAVGLAGQVLVGAAFAIGWIRAGSLHLGGMLYVMVGLFFALLCYYIFCDLREAMRRRRIIESQTAADLLPYDRYTLSSLLFLCSSALLLVVAIPFRPLLYVVGTLMLLALVIFTLAFIGLGYNIVPSDRVMDDDSEDAESGVARQEDSDGTQADAAARHKLADTRVAEISHALSEWCARRGFRDPGINMATLSHRLGVSRQDLTLFFDQHLHSSFRIWLSDVRFQEAQRMLSENPHYSNEAISVECGFSSHAHLYKIFRAKTGMTPKMYKESLAGRDAGEGE